MRRISTIASALVLIAVLAMPASLSAQEQAAVDPNIVVNGERPSEAVATTAGLEIKGVISARNGSG